MLILCADILLRDAQLLFYLQLDGQAVGIPAALALHLLAQQGLVAAEDVLHRSGPSRGGCRARRWPRADLRKT